MPLVFVHGVNTRESDEDYARGVAARKVMFEQLVVPKMVERGFPNFSVADDIYWGDLGVNFGWNLRSVPDTNVFQSLGDDAEGAQNIDLLQLVSDLPSSGEADNSGAAYPLAAAAKNNPAALVRAIFSTEADRFAPLETRPFMKALSKDKVDAVTAQGQHLGFLLIAAGMLARDVEQQPQLIQANTDNEVLEKIQNEVQQRYQTLAQPMLTAGPSQTQELGIFGNPIGWVTSHLKATVNAARKTVNSGVAKTGRGASLIALKGKRDSVSRRVLRFLGDVFVYLHHGRTANPSIYERVKAGILALRQNDSEGTEREPLVVVTHSFGSEIMYDLLTSGALDDVTIDLWVTVGAQTSLFGEMKLFHDMPLPVQSGSSDYVLGRPANVKKWINFYDAADALSYLHEPVFGSAAVTDISVRAQANLTNAHGHYFVDPGFYERIAAEI